jgi:hypothetical protein
MDASSPLSMRMMMMIPEQSQPYTHVRRGIRESTCKPRRMSPRHDDPIPKNASNTTTLFRHPFRSAPSDMPVIARRKQSRDRKEKRHPTVTPPA